MAGRINTPTPKPRIRGRSTGSFGTTGGPAKATFSNDVGAGLSASEEYLVTELSGDVKTILANAVRNRSIPQMGTFGRFGSEIEIPVRNVTARLASISSTTQARVTVQYGFPQGGGGFENDPDDPAAPPQLEVGTSLQPTTTNFDVHEQPLVVTYYSEVALHGEEGPGPFPYSHLAEIEHTEALSTVIYRRKERNNPLQKSLAYAGHIDGDTPFVFGEVRKHHWRCARIAGDTDDGAQTYNVAYEFQRHPETWNPVVSFIDATTGAPPADVTSADAGGGVAFGMWVLRGEGATNSAIYRSQRYPEALFRDLELYI